MRFFKGEFAFLIALTLILLSAIRIECTSAVALTGPPEGSAQMLDTETGICFSGAPQEVRVERRGKIDTLTCEDGSVFRFDHARQQVTFTCMSKGAKKP